MRVLAKKLILLTIFTFCSLIFANRTVFATSSISVSLSPNQVEKSLMPGTFGTVDQTISVSTTNIAGYEVSLSTTGLSSALINQSDSTLTIPTFTLPSGSSSIPVGSLGDGYGISIDSGANYLPVPEPSDSPLVLFHTTTAGSNNHVLTFGFKPSINTVAGTYSNTLNIAVVANLEPCPAESICYYGNNDDGTGTMNNQLASSNSDVTLLASNFSRSGYGFVGWNTAIDGSGTDYGPNQTITTGDLSVEGLQLYAKWIPSAGNLQNWNGCSAMTAVSYNSSTGETTVSANSITALTDTRDGSTYAVVKYPDDKCWMMENLRLDLSEPDLDISGLNTNRPTSTFTNYINNNHPSTTNNFCANNNAACIDQVLYNTNNTNRNLTASYDNNDNASSWYSYGNYYNWYTLTAGNGTYSLSAGGAAADGDICPAGWRLPSGYGDVGDLSVLDVNMGGNGKNQTSGSQAGLAGSVRWRKFPMNFIYSGEQKGTTAANRGISSSNATLNASSADRTANLWLKSDGVYMNSNNTPKVRGQTVRCVFNEGYHINGNIHYDANGGAGTMPDDTNVDFDSAVAANNGFSKTYFAFQSWNTAPDGSGVVVAEGGKVANAADYMGLTEGGTLTLYAIWRSKYSLVYDGNNADDGSMANAKVSNLEAGKQTLVASNYSRAGYGFAGWSLDSNAGDKLLNGQAVTIYGSNELITVNSAFLAHADQTNQITLYAVWLPEDNIYTMQSFGTTECAAMGSGGVIALKDTRDNNVYAVSKLEDGKCWMIENLRLDPSTTDFSDGKTNLPTADFIANAPSSATANTLCNTDDAICIDTIKFNSNNLNRNLTASYSNNNTHSSWYSYGIMYNWYTASAGNGTFAMSSGNVAGDICPAGWRLPTGSTNGELVALNSLANGGSTTSDAGLVKFPDNFIYSGDFNYDTPGGRGSYGRYWSATPNGTTKAYRLGIIASGATPNGSWNKWDAFAVRCIVK